MISFRLAKHQITGVEIVEVLLDGTFVAALYPVQPDGIKFITTHMTSAKVSHAEDAFPGKPFVEEIHFDTAVD